MIDIRYTFGIVRKDNKVFFIGGRAYGSDEVALLKKCEYFDLDTK